MLAGIHRYLSEDSIILDLDDRLEPPEADVWSSRILKEFKTRVLSVMVHQLNHTDKIVNPTKCLKNLAHREFKASTTMGQQLAMPHVRTLQARSLVIGLMRSDQGVFFDGPEEDPVRLFVVSICPPYEDRLYLEFLSVFSRAVKERDIIRQLLQAEGVQDLMGIMCRS